MLGINLTILKLMIWIKFIQLKMTAIKIARTIERYPNFIDCCVDSAKTAKMSPKCEYRDCTSELIFEN